MTWKWNPIRYRGDEAVELSMNRQAYKILLEPDP